MTTLYQRKPDLFIRSATHGPWGVFVGPEEDGADTIWTGSWAECLSFIEGFYKAWAVKRVPDERVSDRRVEPDHLSLDAQRDERREQVRRATDHIGRGTADGPHALPLVSNDPTEVEHAERHASWWEGL